MLLRTTIAMITNAGGGGGGEWNQTTKDLMPPVLLSILMKILRCRELIIHLAAGVEMDHLAVIVFYLRRSGDRQRVVQKIAAGVEACETRMFHANHHLQQIDMKEEMTHMH